MQRFLRDLPLCERERSEECFGFLFWQLYCEGSRERKSAGFEVSIFERVGGGKEKIWIRVELSLIRYYVGFKPKTQRHRCSTRGPTFFFFFKFLNWSIKLRRKCPLMVLSNRNLNYLNNT